MRFFRLYLFFILESIMGYSSKVFYGVIIISLGGLLYLPKSYLLGIYQIIFMFLLIYFIIAFSGNITERTNRWYIELLLIKPFSKSMVLFADFISTISVVIFFSILYLSALWLVVVFRWNEYNTTYLQIFIALTISFSLLYCYVHLISIFFRNTSITILLWTSYILFCVPILEMRKLFIFPHIPKSYHFIFEILYFILPPIIAIKNEIKSFFLFGHIDYLLMLRSILFGACAILISFIYFNKKELD